MLKRWDGDTVCIIASGPSLTRADADYARLAARRVIVLNTSWKECPKADVLYAADAQWWLQLAPTANEFKGERWSSTRNEAWKRSPAPLPVVNLVQTTPGIGLAAEPPIFEGANSAFQALALAVMWGSRNIVFLGLDLQHTFGKTHHHGDHPKPFRNPNEAELKAHASAFIKVVPALVAQDVQVINASRMSALECFPRMTVTNALP